MRLSFEAKKNMGDFKIFCPYFNLTITHFAIVEINMQANIMIVNQKIRWKNVIHLGKKNTIPEWGGSISNNFPPPDVYWKLTSFETMTFQQKEVQLEISCHIQFATQSSKMAYCWKTEDFQKLSISLLVILCGILLENTWLSKVKCFLESCPQIVGTRTNSSRRQKVSCMDENQPFFLA